MNKDYEHSKLTFWMIVFAIFLCILVGTFNKHHSQTAREVIVEIKKQGICYPEIVLSQVKLETGNLQCTDCSMDQNNLFGFRYKGQYICFDTWQESIEYYKNFQDYRYKGNDYYEFLDCVWKHSDGSCARYGHDENYVTKLKEI